MRSRHQNTKLGVILERDWVTTNGLSILRFGAGRRILYNSGNFIFTTSNIPTYHKKHKLTTEVKKWVWDDCKTADGTVNSIVPNSFNTTDIRDYAYYGSCLELIRATIVEIISDFPGQLYATYEYSEPDWKKTGYKVSYSENEPIFKPQKYDISRQIIPQKKDGNCGYLTVSWLFDGEKWQKIIEVENDNTAIKEYTGYYYVQETGKVKHTSLKSECGDGTVTESYKSYYTKDCEYYEYNYNSGNFEEKNTPDGVVDGFVLKNPFNIDLHHKNVNIDTYDNPMRFMSKSWENYCVVTSEGTEEKITNYTINLKEAEECMDCNEGRVLQEIVFQTENDNEFIINAYYISGEIVYVYNNTEAPNISSIQPQKEYIDEYFSDLTGFKRQLLRQDTNPLYSNRFITPVEKNFVIYYPERQYTWPSINNGYCIDITSQSFDNFIDSLYDLGQNFDELWCDNLYRSMTHESIKNFDWTYSRDYEEGDAQDNIDGGERMQKIIRVFGRVFDDIKLYIDTIKIIHNISYDKQKNGPEALISDEIENKGIDVKSTISCDYDIDTQIKEDFLNDKFIEKDLCWANGAKSTLPLWYPRQKSNDIYCDVCDNEIMRRLSLSSKRINQTKGTQQAIEMVLGLFGFGRGVDYEISEEAYFTSKMIPSDECVNGTLDDDVTHKGEDWTQDAFIAWEDITSHNKGDLAKEINNNKTIERLYNEDPLSGITMREVFLGRENTPYLVPYYDSTQIYDGNIFFQGNGGWGKLMKRNGTSLDDILSYQETISYLRVVSSIGDLLSINPNSIDRNSIYFVANLNDYVEYDENPPIDTENNITLSHFFILINGAEPDKFYSWKNIVVQNELDGAGNLQKVTDKEAFQKIFGSGETQEWAYSPKELSTEASDEDKLSTYVYAFDKMVYLDNIISTNVANNPHVGYGKYDDGKIFLEYMKSPFKYAIEQVKIDKSSLSTLASYYKFDDIGDDIVDDKIQILNTRQKNEDKLTDFVKYEVNDEDLTIDYTFDEDKYNSEKRWYINTKVLTIENKLNSNASYKVIEAIMEDGEVIYPQNTIFDEVEYKSLTEEQQQKCIKYYLYDEYFKNIILPYVMQVIPSTTILKLKNFIA